MQREEKHKTILPERLKSQYNLSDREIEIVELLLGGKSSLEDFRLPGNIRTLAISRHTVDTHRRNILEKTGAKSTGELFNIVMS